MKKLLSTVAVATLLGAGFALGSALPASAAGGSYTSTEADQAGWELFGNAVYSEDGVVFENPGDLSAIYTEDADVLAGLTVSDMTNLSMDLEGDGVGYGLVVVFQDKAGNRVNLHHDQPEGVYSDYWWTVTPDVLPAAEGSQGGPFSGSMEELLNGYGDAPVLELDLDASGDGTALLRSATYGDSTVSFFIEETVVTEPTTEPTTGAAAPVVPQTPSKPQLAETGADLTGAGIAAGALFLAGGILLVGFRTRRRAAHRM